MLVCVYVNFGIVSLILPSPPLHFIHSPAKSLHEAKKLLEAKLFSTVELQLWETLPGFCTHPTDVKTVSRPLETVRREDVSHTGSSLHFS